MVRIDPDSGKILDTIEVDALKVTSVVFGGPKLSDFYITTGNFTMNKEEMEAYPHSGYIYEIKNFKVSGRPGVPFEMHESLL